MFLYALTHKNKDLPPVDSWLRPNYSGEDDHILNKDGKKKITYPNNFKDDFPVFTYKFTALIDLKNKLNAAKSKLDEVNTTPERSSIFQKIISCSLSYDLLKGKDGILCQDYGAEIVTNAWLKMYENMHYLEPYLEKISKNSDVFNTFHVAEAPGNFILAINHFLKTKYPNIQWHWLASTYRELYGKSGYLGDTYGLIKKYPQNWVFGADGDGDITSISNLRSFQQSVLRHFKDKADFFTSDVKFVPTEYDYNEEENINVPVHLGHLLCAMLCLKKGGIMMLKEFTFFEAPSVSFLYLMECSFDKVMITKPTTSRNANSEVYIFGIGYRDNLTDIQMNHLLNIMNYIRNLNTSIGSPSIFVKENIPKKFVEQIVELSKKIIIRQIPAIQKNYELFIQYEHDINRLCQETLAMREQLAQEWIEKNSIKMLELSDHLL